MSLCRLHNFCIQNSLTRNIKKGLDLTVLDKDLAYLTKQCILNECHPIILNKTGIPTSLLNRNKIPRVYESNSPTIPMNKMVEDSRKRKLERPNIIQARAKKKK